MTKQNFEVQLTRIAKELTLLTADSGVDYCSSLYAYMSSAVDMLQMARFRADFFDESLSEGI